jgi:hypothetical protein
MSLLIPSVNESTGMGNGNGILSPGIIGAQIGGRVEEGEGEGSWTLGSRLKYCTSVG